MALVVVVAGSISIISSNSDGASSAKQEVSTVTVTGTPLVAQPETGPDPAIGSTIPTITGESFDGSPVTIAPGKPTLVLFVAHWCPHCQREVPLLVSWQQQGKMPADVQVIAVATATTADRDNYPPSKWLANEDFPWPVMADSKSQEAAAAFGVGGFPFFAVYDATGKLVLRTSGEVPMQDLTDQVNAALGR